jgi:hypothetical protein
VAPAAASRGLLLGVRCGRILAAWHIHGLLLALLIVLSLAGALYPLRVPAEYLATYGVNSTSVNTPISNTVR